YAVPGALSAGGIQPAQMYQDMPTGPGTFLTRWGGIRTLYVARVTSPLSNPTFAVSSLDTGQIDYAGTLPGAPQPNSSALIDTGDQRIESAVWSHGQLYATNTVSGLGTPRDFAHWFRVDTTDVSNLRLADQGNIAGGSAFPNLYTYYPSVTVD